MFGNISVAGTGVTPTHITVVAPSRGPGSIPVFVDNPDGGRSPELFVQFNYYEHLPTNIVVTCQNERSQHKNRDTAMKLLRARLYQLEVDKRQADQEKLEGEKKDIAFGSQIRSYVLQPYQLAKDLRTGYEVGDVQRVLDGDLDGFVEAYLAQKARTSAE